MDRIEREALTVEAMIGLYCRRRHGSKEGLCPDCQALRDYAHLRVSTCRFGKDKPVCAKCPVHCYKPDMRERVRAVMRFSGPRMLLSHPLLAMGHLHDSARTRVGEAPHSASRR
ncbi:MAG TPA: nitrous oxide-stimulated promoter family protein [Rectinemataceae bacterium]|nr:nitrous oxide-stimulated promoter family protein [Rectinemataceae bacterium]